MHFLMSPTLFVSILFAFSFTLSSATNASTRIPLADHWLIQDSAKTGITSQPKDKIGKEISSETYTPQGWINASVPSTILGALLDAGVYDFDPFFGMDLRKLPGTHYEIGTGYNKFPTPPASLFGHGWWYRKTFKLSAAEVGKQIDLHFRGITYRAEIWLNGKKIAGTDEIAGTYRTYSFNITSLVKFDQENTLAVQVFTPNPKDLTHNWVDWNPTPQDKSMGLWREVYLVSRGDVALTNPQVITKLEGTGSSLTARLTAEVEATNSSTAEVSGILSGEFTIDGKEIHVAERVKLKAGETRLLQFSPAQYSELILANPSLWWPNQMGKPTLHRLKLRFEIGRKDSDVAEIRFGIREITSELTPEGSRLYRVNGKPIFIRGAGWNSEMFLRFSKERVQKELEYVKHLNLNTLRLEGRFEPEWMLDMADEAGILIMPGWVCCNAWQYPKEWTEEHYQIANDSLRDLAKEFRSHASVFTFLYGSDDAPTPRVEKMFLNTLAEVHWPNPSLAAAAARTSEMGGKTGVKMTGPYNYVAPAYWFVDKDKFGGGWGFNTETSPGPAIPPIESLRKFIPKEHLWSVAGPNDEFWSFHAGGYSFQNLGFFNEGLNKRYGTPTTLEEFSIKSQILEYENHRAMFEAYAKNKYHSATGIIQWMLNSAWPSMIWHLYDFYLRPAGSYFGAKKATEPVHIQYSIDDRTVMVVNSTYEPLTRLFAKAQVYDFNLQLLHESSVSLDVAADQTQLALRIPELKNLTKTYFIKLTLLNVKQETLSENFYWLSTEREEFDWAKTTFAYTPTTKEADFTLLNTLPKVAVAAVSNFDIAKKNGVVTLSNSSVGLAFMVHLKVVDSETGEELLPVLWQDNYISLLPGESRTLTVEFPFASLKGQPQVVLDGMNLKD